MRRSGPMLLARCVVAAAVFSLSAGLPPAAMTACKVQLTGSDGYCLDARSCLAGYPQLLSSRLKPVLPLLTKVHDCVDLSSMCCPKERVAAVEAIGQLPALLPDARKCGRISWNGTSYETSRFLAADIDDYMHMAQEKTDNVDIEDPHFGEELFDLMGATGNFKVLGSDDLLERAVELKNYADRTHFYGGLAQQGQFSFVARLEYDTYNPFNHDVMRLCGGVLIDPYWVLTACHCLKTASGNLVSVTLGDSQHRTQTIGVSRTYAHPGYKGKKNDYQNDIGLIKLSKPADLSDDSISVACLPVISHESLLQKYVFAIGWGLVNVDDASRKGLKYARLPIVPTMKCNSILQLNGESQICAGGGLQDTCYGDSGAPLVSILQDEHGENVAFVAGVTSYGPDECGTRGRPGVYTNVQHFMPWILKHLNSGRKDKLRMGFF